MLEYFLVVLIAQAGIIVGYILSRIAPEEIEPGRKILHVLAATLLGLVHMAYIASFSIVLAVIVFILIVFALGVYKQYKLVYIASGLVLSFAVGLPVFTWIAALIMISGFPIGSMVTKPSKRIHIMDFLQNSRLYYLFAVIATIGFFLA